MHKWKNNIKMYSKEMDWDIGDWWIHLAQDRDQWRALVGTGSIIHWEVLE
jgi:hypothetical protein